MTVDLTQPLALLLLLLLPAFWLIARTTRSYLPTRRRRLVLAIRLLAVILLVLAQAVPRVTRAADRQAVAFLLDYSDSVPPQGREQALNWVRQALARMKDNDQAVVIVFGEHAQIEHPLGHYRELPEISSVVDGGHTNIAEAIRLGLASLPTGVARQIVLLSDGEENVEQSGDQARLAAAAGVPISVVQLTSQGGPEVLVRQVETPSFVREGERFTAAITVESNTETHGKLSLLSDNQLLTTQEVDLTPGTNVINLPQEPQPTGFHLFKAQLETDQDTFVQNNEGGSYTVVSGKPRVLVVEGTPGESKFLAPALIAGGLQVDVRAPTEAPLDLAGLRTYESVVLVNVPATAMTAPQMQAAQAYVRDLGGGLVVVGGDQSYGVGRYVHTPLEEALPVQMDLRGRTLTASVALMLVIDISGSMAGGPGASKMDIAKEAASRAIDLLSPQDQVGVLAFDDTNHWVQEPAYLTDPQGLQALIGGLSPGGGTSIYPALESAYDAIVQLDAKVKHIVLLTDGLSSGGEYDALVQKMQQQDITLSSIAIGSDADYNLLRHLADLGRGRYSDATDPFELPQLVLKETQQVARASIIEEPFKLAQVGASPLLEGFNPADLPPLRGYVATTPKPASQVLLVSQEVDPVLAEWQYGLGRVVAWTSDAKNRWAQDWVGWPDFGRFWTAAVKRTIPSPIDRNNQVTVTPNDQGVMVTVDAQSDDRSYVNFLQTRATLVSPDQQERSVELPQVAPGRYETEVPASAEGAYFLNIAQVGADGQAQVARPAGFVVPYSPEYRSVRPNPALLNQLASATGGRTLADPDELSALKGAATGEPRDLWPWLVALASLLFLFEVAARRLRLGWLDAARARAYVLDHWLGRAQRAAPAAVSLLMAKRRVSIQAVAPAQGPPGGVEAGGGTASATVSGTAPRSAAAMGARLLEAKRRADRSRGQAD